MKHGPIALIDNKMPVVVLATTHDHTYEKIVSNIQEVKAREGYVVVLPGYRMVPEGRFPIMLEDSALALAWVRDNIARFGGDPQQVLTLTEPDHLDSKGCQYLQLLLQRQVFGAGPTVIANRNAQEYTTEPVAKTTSYIVQLYSAGPLPVDNQDLPQMAQWER